MRKVPIILLMAVLGSAHAQNKNSDADRVLFTVRDEPVTTGEFIYLYKKNTLKPEDFTESKINNYLDLLVNFKLKVTEARARGLDTTTAFRKEFQSYREEVRKPYQARKEDIERLTREVYQRLGEEVRASHILVLVKPDAAPADTATAYAKIVTLRNRILAGEDFNALASTASEDNSAKINRGDLGYFSAMQMVYPFEEAAFTLPVGKVSAPVRTRFGYHIVLVTDRRPARGEVEVAHLMLRTTGADDKKIKDKIFEIEAQLKAGRAWDDLCKEYSEDPATKNSGGKLRPFGIGALASVPEFEAAAFSLQEPGQVSDPVHTAYGWHLLKLIRKIPLAPYADLEATLRQKVSRDERVQLADKHRREQEKRNQSYTESKDTKQQVFALADTSLTKGHWRFMGDDALRKKILFSFGASSVTVKEFVDFVQQNQKANAMAPGEYLQQLMDLMIDARLGQLEEQRLVREHPELGRLLKEYEEGILLFTIMEKEIWTHVPSDSMVLKAFYESNKTRYQAGERLRARLFTSTDKTFMDQMNQRISRGDSLRQDDLARFKAVIPFRTYQRGDNKAVDKVSWVIGVHRTEVEGTEYLVEVERLLPAGIRTLGEARAQVLADYQDKQEKIWLNQLREKYPVKVNKKNQKSVIRELTQK
ncbi:MAG TPA: peptidylprolyl isomerase [Cyclobacteriaceae bacterium]|nr:peptidylprolyl isomerase [Cyclobacteriaceae bacterium]